jgi:hypothetical protein
MRSKLINSEASIKEFFDYADKVKEAEKDIGRREKTLQAYLEGRKLTCDEVDRATERELVF